jgi:hypothetical protein
VEQSLRYVEDSMSLASEVSTIAVALIQEFGELASFSRSVSGQFNPGSGSTAVPTVVEYAGHVVPTNYADSDIDGEIVLRNDLRLICHTMAAVPQTGDAVVVSGIKYRIQNVNKTVVQGQDIVYDLQVRV